MCSHCAGDYENPDMTAPAGPEAEWRGAEPYCGQIHHPDEFFSASRPTHRKKFRWTAQPNELERPLRRAELAESAADGCARTGAEDLATATPVQIRVGPEAITAVYAWSASARSHCAGQQDALAWEESKRERSASAWRPRALQPLLLGVVLGAAGMAAMIWLLGER